VTILDDPDETVIATVSPPRLQSADEGEEIETETAVVGQEQKPSEGQAADDAGGDKPGDADHG
jgi:large subunit ribosomal protein L25